MKTELCKWCADIYCCMFSQQVTECQDFRPMTNADRIRAMSDDELSSWIADIAMCNNCRAKNTDTANPCKGLYVGCKGNWLDWMKQEVERSEE